MSDEFVKTGTVQFGALGLHEQDDTLDETWVPYIEVINDEEEETYRFLCDKGFGSYDDAKRFVLFIYTALTVKEKKNLDFHDDDGKPFIEN